MSRNPVWVVDELILALELYLREGRKVLSSSNPEVIKLSGILNQLPIHPKELRERKFRNPNGIEMKLGNFRSLDPLVEGSGLTRGNKLEKVVWDEYHNNYDRLREVTESIISHIESKDLPEFIDDDDEDDVEFTEGKILKRVHNVRERKSGIVKKKKEKVLSETGKLECEVCGFDFYEVYGELGKGFCECHHKIPLHQLNQVKKTKMSDLSIVCSNCHRMLHRSKTVMSVEELGEVMEENIGVP